jgi:hypothetical protein
MAQLEAGRPKRAKVNGCGACKKKNQKANASQALRLELSSMKGT